MVKNRRPEAQSSAGVPRKDTPIEKLDQEGSLMHYNAVMLEEMNSKLKLALEFMTALAERVEQLSRQMEQGFAQLNERMDRLEQRMDRLEQRMDRLEQRMDLSEMAQQGLRNDMLDMEQRICSKINRITERSDRHESRLAALESRT